VETYKDLAILVNTKKPDDITKNIPKSKVVGVYENGVYQVAVNWGLDEVIKLTSMKLKNVPTRMQKDYTWPGVYKPFKHQEETSEFLSKNKRAYC